jgi:hypothetical protein
MTLRKPKTRDLTIEGPWRDISRRIRELEKDGWVQQSCEPNPEFTLTTVLLRREFDHAEG